MSRRWCFRTLAAGVIACSAGLSSAARADEPRACVVARNTCMAEEQLANCAYHLAIREYGIFLMGPFFCARTHDPEDLRRMGEEVVSEARRTGRLGSDCRVDEARLALALTAQCPD